MSKRDDDSQADLEVGMTTAERRRRRRRGGSLRIPSDNVPRRSSTPVVAPVPEDPSLAMSIAYSFTSDASEPVPRVALDAALAHGLADPEEGTVRDTVEPEFEMKTREMTAVDLEALGLTDPGVSITTTDPGLPGMVEVRLRDAERTMSAANRRDPDGLPANRGDPDSLPGGAGRSPVGGDPVGSSDVEIDVAGLDGGSAVSDSVPSPIQEAAPATPDASVVRGRINTVALTEEDLEEVREAVRAATEKTPGPVRTPSSIVAVAPPPPPAPSKNKTQPLSPLDIEEDDKTDDSESRVTAPESVPEIDINEFSELASAGTGEIEVDVAQLTDYESKSAPIVVPSPDGVAARSSAQADTIPARPSATTVPQHDPKRGRPPTVPPSVPSNQASSGGHTQPPPPPPAQHKAPPTPPPAPTKPGNALALAKPKPSAAAPATGRTANDSKLAPRGKPWFVDLFGEDYLRTLPFLTPQATQAEAEFVIDAMGLTQGAHILDVGCGYGRHAMELAARGFHVVGLDLSKPLLDRGQEEAQRRGLQINFVVGDMRELAFEAQFDAAYCLFSTFGYFDDETNKKTITNIARALKPSGRVMIEILNRDYVIADLPTRVWWEGDGCVVLEEVELNYFSSRITVNRSVVFDDGRQLEQEISVRAYSLHEVGKLMHAAGFRVLEVSGGYHTRGRFFGNQSRHIIVLAERKDS